MIKAENFVGGIFMTIQERLRRSNLIMLVVPIVLSLIHI